MVSFTGGLLLFSALAAARPSASAPPSQHVLDISDAGSQAAKPRQLRGRFLHITDIHPDPFYRQGSDPEGEHPCHRGEGSSTGYFGAEKTECDTPFSLVNATFDWIKENIRDEVDFVVWTGDSARHDNDEKYPRTIKQVEQLNEFVVTKFDETFGKPDNRHDRNPTNDFVIPIVPTYGNNDILPHNIFTPGPNKWTRKYLTIWDKFVPPEQRHSFARGGWFFTEVIPNRLAVFSLNTLYFFDSNAAVDGCADPNEPGYEHFEWLRIQLEFLRERKMKAILTGHVPPARTQGKQSWDETCYQKYTLWLRQYRDVIVGSMFGHMNLDHFMLQDTRQLTYKFPIDGIDTEGLREDGASISDGLNAEAKADYLSDLRQLWGNLPKPPKVKKLKHDLDTVVKRKSKRKQKKYLKEIGGPYGERFSLSLIGPSIVPNFYPTLRIVEYNITGLEHDHPALAPTSPMYTDPQTEEIDLVHTKPGPWLHTEDFESDLSLDEEYEAEKKKKKHRGKKKKRPKPDFRVPDPPSTTSPPGPGYSPQTLSFLSWKQLYANLTKINEAVAKDLRSEESLAQTGTGDEAYTESHNKHFTYELEYDTREDKMYRMKDLTMRSWLIMAEKIGREAYSLQDAMDEDFDDDINDFGDNDTGEDEDNTIDDDSVVESDDDDPDTEDEKLSTTINKHKKGKKRKDKALKKNHLWHAFVKRAFVSTKSDDELEDEFG
ncbi:Endopolyphosphatase [Knufia obscura]|uniref:Endopolyphosphatase n=2 Tax=Knufia TaxID=430999 RepID=A0AAN8EU39_9EURO|nr:Endopolyphosphatase [Knufia obscura]KAK5958887.1 Endopolyphosphatase [Knufia fluminis]